MAERINVAVETTLRNYGIHRGIPASIVAPGRGHLQVPQQPHVLFFKDIYLNQPDAQLDALLRQMPFLEQDLVTFEAEGQERRFLHMQSLMAMFAHGIVTGPTIKDWKFMGTNKPVDDTVRAYEQVAGGGDLPHLDIIIACKTGASRRANVGVSMRQRPYINAGDTITIWQPMHLNDPQPYKHLALAQDGEGATATVHARDWMGIDLWVRYKQMQEAMGIRRIPVPEWTKSIKK